MSEQTPNPGSAEAIKAGCTCPRIDNGHGTGARGTSGPNADFYIAFDCPLHCLAPTQKATVEG